MKIPILTDCSCGYRFTAFGYGSSEIPPANCPQCGQRIHMLDPLTISVVADRLLLRSHHDMISGDFTVSIICAAMAVECALTQVFLKWRKLNHLSETQKTATELEQIAFEREYKKKTSPGGFAIAADFVSASLTNKKYDEFVTDFIKKSSVPELIKAGFPKYESQAKAAFIHEELFAKRNRIMHWGEVSYSKETAASSLAVAGTAISVFKTIDREKYVEMEKHWRLSILNQSP